MIGYFRHIFETVTTIFDGLTVTFSYLFQKPVTVQYPNALEKPVTDLVPEGYRGLLEFSDEKCTACELCMKACPIDCIYTTGLKIPGRRGKTPVVFSIDLGKCMFCGLCVDACATGSLTFSKEFEGATYDLKDLVRQYIPPEVGRQRIQESKRARAEEAANAAAAAIEAQKQQAGEKADEGSAIPAATASEEQA